VGTASSCVTLLGTALHCTARTVAARSLSGTPLTLSDTFASLSYFVQYSTNITPYLVLPHKPNPTPNAPCDRVSNRFCLAPLQSAPSSTFLGTAKPSTYSVYLSTIRTPLLTFRSQHQILPPRLAILYTQTSCLITSICVSSPPAHHVSNHACAGLLLFVAVYLQWQT
jgi:hypothetical protein